MHISRIAGVPLPCVPVSTTDTLASKFETKAVNKEPKSLHEIRLEVAESINVLVDAGYRLGCDGELLPPMWVRKDQVGADA